ncbi:MAG: hypothetical protein GWN84_10005 [Gammaproteobacteria bacterium]|nr:hypothetical protein [Gammaproteobacteria bacterium]NIR83197.1 hypothetical protein [Gammaproteobacteria bacterium]NIR91005.1 hypothetical protein [Gammaproteobacteria bacterium]NIU04362.1 hypothetical protein [Gammaproteobacteria bacterium]NIV52585.1 hypothetical protein [Gammaproteobacteria bacterium]
MAFAYYAKLSREQKAIYRKSDAVASIRLHGAWSIRPLAEQVRSALESQDRGRVERHARQLAAAILADLGLAPVNVRVLSARPSRDWGELHGLYEHLEGTHSARITLWMRTARHKRVVAFRTFLRTLLHELCHHLDYELLALEDSFHTEGFFKRESSLLHQLLDS